MGQNIIQLIVALLGSLGFAMLFQLRLGLLPWASLGGLLNWAAYLLLSHFTENIFLSTVFAAAIAVLYCDIIARLLKAPVTLFLVPAIVPSVPGSALFYTMSCIATSDWAGVRNYGTSTVKFTLGLAAGICFSTVIFAIVNKLINKHSKHN